MRYKLDPIKMKFIQNEVKIENTWEFKWGGNYEKYFYRCLLDYTSCPHMLMEYLWQELVVDVMDHSKFYNQVYHMITFLPTIIFVYKCLRGLLRSVWNRRKKKEEVVKELQLQLQIVNNKVCYYNEYFIEKIKRLKDDTERFTKLRERVRKAISENDGVRVGIEDIDEWEKHFESVSYNYDSGDNQRVKMNKALDIFDVTKLTMSLSEEKCSLPFKPQPSSLASVSSHINTEQTVSSNSSGDGLKIPSQPSQKNTVTEKCGYMAIEHNSKDDTSNQSNLGNNYSALNTSNIQTVYEVINKTALTCSIQDYINLEETYSFEGQPQSSYTNSQTNDHEPYDKYKPHYLAEEYINQGDYTICDYSEVNDPGYDNSYNDNIMTIMTREGNMLQSANELEENKSSNGDEAEEDNNIKESGYIQQKLYRNYNNVLFILPEETKSEVEIEQNQATAPDFYEIKDSSADIHVEKDPNA